MTLRGKWPRMCMLSTISTHYQQTEDVTATLHGKFCQFGFVHCRQMVWKQLLMLETTLATFSNVLLASLLKRVGKWMSQETALNTELMIANDSVLFIVWMLHLHCSKKGLKQTQTIWTNEKNSVSQIIIEKFCDLSSPNTTPLVAAPLGFVVVIWTAWISWQLWITAITINYLFIFLEF